MLSLRGLWHGAVRSAESSVQRIRENRRSGRRRAPSRALRLTEESDVMRRFRSNHTMVRSPSLRRCAVRSKSCSPWRCAPAQRGESMVHLRRLGRASRHWPPVTAKNPHNIVHVHSRANKASLLRFRGEWLRNAVDRGSEQQWNENVRQLNCRVCHGNETRQNSRSWMLRLPKSVATSPREPMMTNSRPSRTLWCFAISVS